MSASKVLNIFAATACVQSHIVRFMAEEKGLEYRVIDFAANGKLAALAGVKQAPAISDRDLTTSELDIIMEYMEERHPDPALLPVNVATRAIFRNQVRSFHKDLFPLLDAAVAGCKESREKLTNYLRELNQLATGKAFFASDEMTIMDVTLTPWLYAATQMGMSLKGFPSLNAYAERMFARPAFMATIAQPEESEAA